MYSTVREILSLPVSEGTLLMTTSDDIYTHIEGVKPERVALHSQQRLKPKFKVIFQNGLSIKPEGARVHVPGMAASASEANENTQTEVLHVQLESKLPNCEVSLVKDA